MSYQKRSKEDRWRRTLMVFETLGVGVFYMGVIAFLLYPVVHAAA